MIPLFEGVPLLSRERFKDEEGGGTTSFPNVGIVVHPPFLWLVLLSDATNHSPRLKGVFEILIRGLLLLMHPSLSPFYTCVRS